MLEVKTVIFTKQNVIELISKMKTLDRDYAELVYLRENERRPEWNLRDAFVALKAAK
jgi:hypothetical protein